MPHRLPRPKLATKIKTPSTGTRRVASLNALQRPGDYCFIPRDETIGIYELACIMPLHARPSGIIVKKVANVVRDPQAAPHVWNWDGNVDRPTVNPQIVSKDGRHPWTGFLINGAFVETKGG